MFLSSYKAILFDYDDTLVQTKQSKWAALKETAKRGWGLTITDEDLRKYWGLPFEEMLTGAMRNADTFERLRDLYYQVTLEFPMQPHLGAVELIEKLVRNGILVGIVTASSRKLVIDDLTTIGFPVSDFFTIQTAEDSSFHKPDPRVFDALMGKLMERGIGRDQVLYIGDSTRDFEAARDADIAFLGVTHGTNTAQDFRTLDVSSIDSFIEAQTM